MLETVAARHAAEDAARADADADYIAGVVGSVSPEQRAQILRFAPSEDEVSTATLDEVLADTRDNVRSAVYLRAGDVITVAERQIVVCTLGDPYRDSDGVHRVVITGTGDYATTVTVPVRCTDLFVVA